MQISKTSQLSAILLAAASVPLLASAGEQKWIGGDQSAVQSSIEVAANWNGNVPVSKDLSADYSFTIDQNGAKATFATGDTGYYINGAFTRSLISFSLLSFKRNLIVQFVIIF